MSRSPLVSVVTPVYNAAEHLGVAIRSILDQTLSNLEFIIVDDGSTDRSPKIIEEYALSDERIAAIRQENRGVAAALNRGLDIARGTYIARMDADDASHPDRMAKQAAFLNDRPEIGLCGTAWTYSGERRGSSMPITDSEEIRVSLMFWPCVSHPTAMMRRSLIAECGLRYDPCFEQAEDYELWTRLCEHCGIANLPEALLRYRISARQATAAHEAEVWRWSARIHRRQLGLLGIVPTDDDIRVHQAICGRPRPLDREDVRRAEAWLEGIMAANEQARVFDADAVRRAMFNCWRRFCLRAADMGIWTWPAFRRSSLVESSEAGAHSLAEFVVRFLARARDEKARWT